MAFAAANFIPGSAQANSDAPRNFHYKTTVDNLAAVKAASYFDNAALPTGGLGLKDGDIILAKATDGMSFLEVAVASPSGDVTINAANDFA